MLKPQIDVFMGCDAPFDRAHTVLFGAPFDSTTSNRPGTRFGPGALRRESYGLELYSPYQERDLSDTAVLDSGDLELPLGDSALVLEAIQARTEEILSAGKRPFLLGGEHLVTLGAVRAAAKKYPDLHVIQFDAHADLREDYLGAQLSHACVMRRCYELLGRGRIHQFCIRSGDWAEWEFAKGHTDLHRFDFSGLAEVTKELKKAQTPVYFTIDLDCLDPSVLPGTGTPEAGGVGFIQLLEAIFQVCETRVVGADLNELAPMLDASGVSTATACKTLRELLLALHQKW